MNNETSLPFRCDGGGSDGGGSGGGGSVVGGGCFGGSAVSSGGTVGVEVLKSLSGESDGNGNGKW